MDGLLDDIEYEGSFSFDELQSQSTDEELENEEVLESEEQQEDVEQDSEEQVDESEEELDEDVEQVEEEEDLDSYAGLVEYLTEQGVIPEDLDLEVEDSPEGLVEVFSTLAERKFENLVGSLSPKAQALIEAELNGGNIEDAFKELDDIDYNQIDIEDEDVRRELLTDYYKSVNPKWSDTKIEKMVNNAFDLGDDTEEATEARDYFVEKQVADREAYLEGLRQQREAQDAQLEETIATYHELIDKSNGFAGLEFSSKKEKEEFRSYLFDKGKDGLTGYERDLAEPEDRLKQAMYSFKKYSFETIEKKAKTEAVVKLKKVASRHSDRNATASSKQPNTRVERGFSLGDID